jgi:anti-sigma factor RsiW
MIAANDQERPGDPVLLDLMAYLDGELAPERVAEVEKRLAGDPVYARKLQGLLAVADFVRDDADRIYASGKIDSIADEVMGKVARQSAPPSALLPLSSVQTRRRKNTVIWVSFGVVAAAAAALFLYVRTHDHNSSTANVPQAPAQTIAVNTATNPPSKDPAKMIEETAKHEVEGLEVGEGATVIYRSNDSPIVWVTKKKEDGTTDPKTAPKK